MSLICGYCFTNKATIILKAIPLDNIRYMYVDINWYNKIKDFAQLLSRLWSNMKDLGASTHHTKDKNS